MRNILYTLVVMAFANSVYGQVDATTGLMPSINLSKRVSNVWSLRVSNQMRIQSLDFGEDQTWQPAWVLNDLTLSAARRINTDFSLNTAYLLRYRNEQVIHRVAQQLNYFQRFDDHRVGHRLGVDFTMAPDRDHTYRMRYRTVYERSISGDKIDRHEFYIKFGQEILAIHQQGETSLELRLLPNIGYEISRLSKIELGVDLRFGDILLDQLQQRHWLVVNWFYVLT